MLKLPEGNFSFNIKVIDCKIYTSYTLKSQPLNVSINSSTIEKIKNALPLSFMKHDIGVLLNANFESARIIEYGKKMFGGKVDSDFFGVRLVDCGIKNLSFTATPQSDVSGDSFFQGLNDSIGDNKQIDERLRRAIEIYNPVHYLSKVNSSGIFILSMSAVECLISQKENPSEVLSIIGKVQESVKILKLAKEIENSICGSINFLKYESIKRSGKALVEKLFHASDEKFNDLSPADFFSKAYDLRSKLVHEGKLETKFLSIQKAQMQQFASSCLRKYYLMTNAIL